MRALADSADMDGWATTRVALSEDDEVVGAISTSPYNLGEDAPPVTLIHTLGSLAPGVGTALVREAIVEAQQAGHGAVYVESIAESEGFYRRLGFVDDPLELGSPFWGILAEHFGDWLRHIDSDWANQVSARLPGSDDDWWAQQQDVGDFQVGETGAIADEEDMSRLWASPTVEDALRASAAGHPTTGWWDPL